MKPIWTRVIRFEAEDDRLLRGEPVLPSETFDLGSLEASHRLRARVLEGADIFDISGQTKFTGEEAVVKKLLGPLAQADVPILRCVGLNYAKHSKSRLQPRHSRKSKNLHKLQSERLEGHRHLSPSSSSSPTPVSGTMVLMSLFQRSHRTIKQTMKVNW